MAQRILLLVALGAAAFGVVGCGDADQHPSQMTKMRDSMQQQRKEMKAGMTTAPGTPNSGTTGK